MKIDDNNVSGVVFKKSIKNIYAETKTTFSAAKYKKCSCFHICAATERPNIFRVAAGTHH